MKNKFIILSIFLILFSLTDCRKKLETPPKEDETSTPTFESTSFILDNKLKEISGLQIEGNRFYGFNDSGGEAKLFKLNNLGEIIQTIILENATNIDWESMTMSDTKIYLADTGNNKGNRTNLCIYSIQKNNLNSSSSTISIDAEKINFYYPEQSNFNIQTYNHDFDCEAMIWFNNKLHLFTKEWKSKKTHHYTLSDNTATQAAELMETYPTQFLVTGADIIPLNNQESLLGLIGYKISGEVFLLRTKINNSSSLLFNETIEKTLLGNTNQLGQVEGIVLKSEKIIYYSAEEYNNIPQHITKLEQTN